MKTFKAFFTGITFLLFAFSASNSQAQNTKTTLSSSGGDIEVIQFHSEHRCMTCNKIEALAKETLKGYENVPFTLVNVDDKKNEQKAGQFEATGTALFLFNSKTGKKKDLTDFAFMNAGNEGKFIAGLKKEIDLFLKK
jgi:hypothetical protein